MLRVCEKLRELDAKAKRRGLSRTETDYLHALVDAMADMDRAVEVELLKTLGDVNLEKGQLDKDKLRFDRAMLLYRTALLQSKDAATGDSLENRLRYAEKLRVGKAGTIPDNYEPHTDNDKMCSPAKVAQRFLQLDRRLAFNSGRDSVLIEYTKLMIEGVINEDNLLETEAIKSLGDVYLKRGRETRDPPCLTKATALYNTALARCEGVEGKVALIHRLLHTARIRQDMHRTANKGSKVRRRQHKGHLSWDLPDTSSNTDVIGDAQGYKFMNDSDHKVALPEKTSLPRSLAEKLLDGGYFILRHTGSFISNVWKVVMGLWKRGEEEEEEDQEEEEEEKEEEGEEGIKPDKTIPKKNPSIPLQTPYPSHTPRRQLSRNNRSDMETPRKERFRGTDKINPETPVSSKTGKLGSSSNVNRKLFPGTPESLRVRQTRGETDTRLKGNREMYPRKAVGTQDMQNTSGSVTTAGQLKKSGTSHQLSSDGSLDLEFASPLEQHRHGQDKSDPEPTVLSKTGNPDSSSKVNSTPGPLRQDRLPDICMMYPRKTVSTFYMRYKAKRIRWRANGIPNMRYKTNRKMYPRKAGGTRTCGTRPTGRCTQERQVAPVHAVQGQQEDVPKKGSWPPPNATQALQEEVPPKGSWHPLHTTQGQQEDILQNGSWLSLHAVQQGQ
ncbi:uncharacterized protein LOC144919325 isoform X2 [Branchiostoma floridae x Branchiostoma belcheri]